MAKTTKKQSPINAQQTVDEAFGAILTQQFERLGAWQDRARSWDDIEGVHQMRVALRRMRAVLRTFRPAIPRQATDSWSREMRWINDQLGAARDLDVFLDQGLHQVGDQLPLAGKSELAALARQRREQAYLTVNEMLDGERYRHFRQNFKQWLDDRDWQLAELDKKQRKRLRSPIKPFAEKRLHKLEKRVLDQGHSIDQDSAQAMHKLRIECKKLRYAAEFFSPLFKHMGDFISHLKLLQDLLGTLNDIAVMQHLLDELLADSRDKTLFLYAGGLIGWRAHEYRVIKRQFDARWREFVDGGTPWKKNSAV